MKKLFLIAVAVVMLSLSSMAQLSFYLVDNFEDGTFSKWFVFDSLKPSVIKPPTVAQKDLVAESCGEYALKLEGAAKDWYVGGLGTNLSLDASEYSRLQFDVYGSVDGGKIKLELYEDDNGNSLIEQDDKNNWAPTKDDIWYVEIPILGKGYTRYSIPLSAFTDSNPGVGDDIFNPVKTSDSGGLLRVQMIFVAKEQQGKVDAVLDNILFTY